jgi:hypothetical protein
VFQGGESLCLFQIALFSYVEETPAFLEEKPSVLKAGASRTLFPFRIDLVWERNTSCKS